MASDSRAGWARGWDGIDWREGGRRRRVGSIETAGGVGGALALSVILHLAFGKHRLHGFGAGGLIGEYGAELCKALIGTVGAVLVAVAGLALSVVAATPITMRGI